MLESLNPSVFVDARAADWTEPFGYRLQPTALRFELGEVSFAAKLGLGVALDYALSLGLDNIEARVRRLADTLRAALAELPAVTVRDLGVDLSGICTFTVADVAAPDAVGRLRQGGFNTSVGAKEMSRLDLGMRGLDSVVRASIHYYNTDDEIDRFVGAVAALS
ncbi:MAG: aminotransferase class V-fold PLP-dependent enzyme [Acidimicrobiales bacterium]